MLRRLPSSLLLALLCLPASAQGIYQNANSPTDAICPRVDKDKTSLNFGSAMSGTTGGQVGADSTSKLYYQQMNQLYPQGQRKSVAAFAAYDAKGKGTTVASLKGKVVLVGLWSVRCDPSAKMLMELAGLYPKRDHYGFDILAVNFDENQQDEGIQGGWRAINTFMTKNKGFFEVSKMPVFTPGLGVEGASNFMDIVHSLPALFVIDRQGNLSQLHLGYKDGFVGEALKLAVREKALPVVKAPNPDPAGKP